MTEKYLSSHLVHYVFTMYKVEKSFNAQIFMDSNSPTFYFVTYAFSVLCKKYSDANLSPDFFLILLLCLGLEHFLKIFILNNNMSPTHIWKTFSWSRFKSAFRVIFHNLLTNQTQFIGQTRQDENVGAEMLTKTDFIVLNGTIVSCIAGCQPQQWATQKMRKEQLTMKLFHGQWNLEQ